MMRGPPGLPTTSISRPSGSSTMVGVIDDSIRLPGPTALASPCTSPNMLGWPGADVKSSISLLRKKPAPSTTTRDPKPPLRVVVTDTAVPSASTTE